MHGQQNVKTLGQSKHCKKLHLMNKQFRIYCPCSVLINCILCLVLTVQIQNQHICHLSAIEFLKHRNSFKWRSKINSKLHTKHNLMQLDQ